MKKLFRISWIFCMILFIFLNLPLHAQNLSPVYVAPVKGTIDAGTQAFLNRVYAEAAENNASAVLLEIDTPGGFVWSAVQMKSTIRNSEIPTIAFVENGAISAGTLIALTSKNLVMSPGSTMGAAEPQLGGKLADAKTLSYWVGELEGSAEQNGRDKLVAKAMADAEVEIPGVVAKGELLTLTPQVALELGMIDDILPNRQAVLDAYNLTDKPIIELEPASAELFVRFITNPYVSTILLTVGIAGLVLEIFTAGFGIAGILGLISLSLYFFGHILAGLTGFEAVLLFIIGVALLAAEVLFIPGFGVAGIGGIIALMASIIVAAPTVNHGIMSLVIAIIGTAILLTISLKFLPTRNVWKGLVLGEQQLSEEGYNAPATELKDLLGMEGISLTPLRPSGTAKIGEQQVDVITQGSFIPTQTKIKVIKVEGIRVIVEKIQEVES